MAISEIAAKIRKENPNRYVGIKLGMLAESLEEFNETDKMLLTHSEKEKVAQALQDLRMIAMARLMISEELDKS